MPDLVPLADAFSIGPGYHGRPGTGWGPYSRPGRNGRGAAADKRRARKRRNVMRERARR